ncbi:cysteine--tRNA ligase [Marinococcus halophilus]|uniref:Cysteine--tRNA ligase n=1 Tax=Marinococcus halophilus TaxID=1371 RepID=A0A510Y8M6_MARHA|nr:cysteine--tRNA ligase [Marinococcus halophilus]OZT79313.1 cysteine--tRNA ligase [Marinococcus halophilus]GEK59699.1 cysteine--tRNA ligase [Marinococcus halophilus]
MAIHIYNSLTNKKEPFQPIDPDRITMYVCGPTVYNYIHIGNARPAIVFDAVRRYLSYRGYNVYYVSNFTDVDDKIIKAAQEMNEEVPTLANRFIDTYLEDIESLGVEKADLHPRATETVEEMVEFIEQLIAKGFAYESNGDVYYRTKKFKEYGKLSSQSVGDLQMGARIEIGEQKEDPMDFTLWKKAKENEIAWDSPWGEGRPGWHIECSAMVKKYMGDTIDIHAGGQDLKFPHHENEIAQTEALTGKPMAHYWMHNGYININNEKMSKSLGNFVLVHDMIQQHDPEVIRFFMMQAHYRNPINFDNDLLESARAGLERLRSTLENVKHRRSESVNGGSSAGQEAAERAKARFLEEMDDDFNTANAISVLFDLAREANKYMQQPQTSIASLDAIVETMTDMGSVLGVSLEREEVMLDEDIEKLLEERVAARKNKNFARADEIRDQLENDGILLEDTPQGTRWKRK